MPRHRKPSRLVWHPADSEYFVHDGPERHRTGCREEGERDAAEAVLSKYIEPKPAGAIQNAEPDKIAIGVLLEAYATAKAGKVARASTMAFCLDRLTEFWGDKTPAEVDEATCAEYLAVRAEGFTTRPSRGEKGARVVSAGPATVRRELGVLQSALKYSKKKKLVREIVDVDLPPAAAPRDRCLTRQEAAWILRASARHVRRFVVLALYTGRRATAILELGWRRTPSGGLIDIRRGLIDFMASGKNETKKRRGEARMSRALLAHAKRWSKHPGERVIEWRGQPVAEIDTAFTAACRRAEEMARAHGVELDLSDVSPHVLKHTSVCWFFQRGGSMEDAVSYFATSPATLHRVYRNHSPAHQQGATDVWDRRRK